MMMAAATAGALYTPWIPTPLDRSHCRFLLALHLSTCMACPFILWVLCDLVIHSGSYMWTDRFALATADVLSKKLWTHVCRSVVDRS